MIALSIIESAVANKLIQQGSYSELEQEKIRFGVRLIWTEVYKMIIVYIVAFALDSLLPTMVTHLSFYILRQVSFGYHFSSVTSCMAWSIVAFPILSAVLNKFPLNSWVLWGGGGLAVVIMMYHAPVGTKKHPIVNEKHRLFLRKKLWMRLFIVGVFLCLVPVSIQSFIVLGLIIQSVVLLMQVLGGEES